LAKTSNSRRSWHVRANALVFGYAALGLIALLIPIDFHHKRWLVVHLFLLGSVTNCIVTWTEHFAVTLLRVPEPSRKGSAWRLITLNASVLVCLFGVSIDLNALVILGTSCLAAVMIAHSYSLSRLSKRALQNRFAGTVHFYLAGAACLILGIVLGAASVFQNDGSLLRDSLHAGHLHANLFGWVGVTVMGTLFTFWPTVLRTKMVDAVMVEAKRALPFLLVGVFVAAIALTMNQRFVAAAGMGIYLIGVLFAARPFSRTWRQKKPHDLPSFAIAFACIWFVLGALADFFANIVFGQLSNYVQWLDHLIPVFLVGFAAQLLLGALSFLVPVILGGGPAAVRGHIERLSLGWQIRIFAFNLSALLIALRGALAQVGYGLFIVSLGIFIGLVLYTVLGQGRESKNLGPVLS